MPEVALSKFSEGGLKVFQDTLRVIDCLDSQSLRKNTRYGLRISVCDAQTATGSGLPTLYPVLP